MHNPKNLILTRTETEGVSLTISPEELRDLADSGKPLRIEVNAVRLSRRRARLGFRAPQCVTICRMELEELTSAM